MDVGTVSGVEEVVTVWTDVAQVLLRTGEAEYKVLDSVEEPSLTELATVGSERASLDAEPSTWDSGRVDAIDDMMSTPAPPNKRLLMGSWGK